MKEMTLSKIMPLKTGSSELLLLENAADGNGYTKISKLLFSQSFRHGYLCDFRYEKSTSLW